MDKNQGYEIIKAVMLENGRGFALGHHPTAPSPYVTWACYDDKDGQRQYEWGHYGSDRAALEQDFAARVQEYQRLYNVGVKQTEAPGLYKYYSTQRPVDIGTFPGGEAKVNEAENRLQLIFAEKPDADTRQALKSEGFKWAPSQGAWQRQLNQNAIRAAARLDFLRPEDGKSPYQLQPFAKRTEKDVSR